MWSRRTATGRWYGFGRYYAMFPPSFAYDAIVHLTDVGEQVLDPFCGRGNAPFTATVLQRRSVGVDINPLAWLYTIVKLRPAPEPSRILRRLEELIRAQRMADRRSRSKFETMAWAPNVRAFLRAARRELDWKNCIVDRTLMAFVVLHMQDKKGQGMSNALWPTIACSAQYAVRWWTTHEMTRPPCVDPKQVLEDKIRRRYAHGVPKQSEGTAVLGDAQCHLKRMQTIDAGLLITSPPYRGVTDYWNEHWIRLWMLGHRMRKDWGRSAKFENGEKYRGLLKGVFSEAKGHLKDGAAVLVRSDRRRQTARTCLEVIRETWPDEEVFVRFSAAEAVGVSVLHGRGGSRANEMDFLIPGDRGSEWWKERGFREGGCGGLSRELSCERDRGSSRRDEQGLGNP